MPFRPEPQFRRNIKGVIYPLTEAIRRAYGSRQLDDAYPIGAFYPINVTNETWRHADGIWYVPLSEASLNERNPREEVVLAFIHSMRSGTPVELPSGIVVTWERIPTPELQELPADLA